MGSRSRICWFIPVVIMMSIWSTYSERHWETLSAPLRRRLCQKFDLVFCGSVGWCSSRLWIINGIFSLSLGSSGGKRRMRGSWEAACDWLPLSSDIRKWNSTLFPLSSIDGLVHLGCPLLSVTRFLRNYHTSCNIRCVRMGVLSIQCQILWCSYYWQLNHKIFLIFSLQFSRPNDE